MSKPFTRTLRLDEEVDEQLQSLATADRRSLNNMVEFLIVSEVRRREATQNQSNPEAP